MFLQSSGPAILVGVMEHFSIDAALLGQLGRLSEHNLAETRPPPRRPSTWLVQHATVPPCPSWHQLLQGLRPQQPALDEMEPGFFSQGCSCSLQKLLNSASVQQFQLSKHSSVLNQGPMSGLFPTFRHPFLFFCSLPHSSFPGASASAPLASHSSCFAHLPVWPSPRCPWPSPCSVCESKCSWRSWFLKGECNCPGLP